MKRDDSLPEKIAAAIKFLEDSEARLERGDMVNLKEFESDMIKLCAKIQARSREEAIGYLGGLQTIMEGLNRLETLMQSRKNMIKTELEILNAGHKAATAYRKTPPEGE